MFENLASEIAPQFDAVADALRGEGWLMLPGFLSEPWCEILLADCRARSAEFAGAAIGRGAARQASADQRSDKTLWLNEALAPQSHFLEAMSALRNELNRRLFIGLHDYEAHYAHYAPGTFYRRHRDAFASSSVSATNAIPQRILSSVFYLNSCVGGELLLWRDEREIARIKPVAGSAVFFMSSEFPHEVLPAQSDRYSIAGWFRSR